MKKILFVCFLGLVLFFFTRGPKNKVPFPTVVMTADTGVQEVPYGQRQEVILFTGTRWCGACQMLDKQVIRSPQWKEFTEEEIYFVSYDIPGDRAAIPEETRKLMSQYGIRHFPTMLVLDESRKVIGRMSGAGPPVENYKAWIRAHREET